MDYSDLSLNEIASVIQSWREKKGFKTPWSIYGKNADKMLGKLMLVTTEVAEAAEAVRHGDVDNFQEELADIIIRVLDIASTMGVDIQKVIEKKMEFNETRDYRHGKETTL